MLRSREKSGGAAAAGTFAMAMAAIVILCAAAAPAYVAAQEDGGKEEPAGKLGVVYTDGRKTESVSLFRIEKPSEEFFISAYDLARVFKATRYWNPGARKLVLRMGDDRFLFTIDTRVVLVNDEPVMMRVPVRYSGGLVMIPLEFISEIYSPKSGGRIDLDDTRLVLTIGTPQYNVTGIEFTDDESGSRAVISVTEELLYHADNDTPGLLRLKIYGGRLNALKISASQAKGLFNRVRAEQADDDSYLFFDVRRSAARFRVEFVPADRGEGREGRLVIFLEKGNLPEIPEADYAGRRMTEIFEDSPRPGFNLNRIAIDAGHGGVENGKVSPSGILEKDVNLDIARLLKQRLEEEFGVEVVMTRTGDDMVPLGKRAETANSEGADLFMSIHCNGWFHPDACGFETFFLAPARNEYDERIAREENASLEFEKTDLGAEEIRDLDFMLWDMVQNEFISESSTLAELVQREMSGAVSIRNRGVKQAGFMVLKGLKMPAILIEVAFLSNPEEERLLQDGEFRASVVEGIVSAVRRYREMRSGAPSER
jgi:N-acetylmuramoyl-L-alanine amidase